MYFYQNLIPTYQNMISFSQSRCVVAGIILQLGAQMELVSGIELRLQMKLHSYKTGSEGVKKIKNLICQWLFMINQIM